MTCPKCGQPMPEGALYCESCGEEIHIVPEFDLELEESISRGMESVRARVEEEVGASLRTDPSLTLSSGPSVPEEAADAPTGKRRSFKGLMTGLVLTVLILPGISILGFMFFRHHSVSYQLNQAQSCRERMEYGKAVAFYKRAIELAPDQGEIRLLLAETYQLMGDLGGGEQVLLQITDREDFSEESRIRAYGRLAALYQEQERYKDLSDLLLACTLETVRDKYSSLMALPPAFSFEEGDYKEILPLKLMSASPGDIYYTLDGGDPLTEGELYTGPVFLEDGSYLVTACFVSERGVASKIVSREYRIAVEAVAAPDIWPYGGTYSEPVMLRVASGSERDIYYTTDGTDPNMQSEYFTGYLPLPLGETHYRFAYITEDGRSSLIADRVYSLTLQGEFTADMAAGRVMEYMLFSEKVYDEQGHVSEGSSASYDCECLYAVEINGSDYYILEEVYTDTGGQRTYTGSLYGVEAYTGAVYRVRMQEAGTYTLTEPLLQQ